MRNMYKSLFAALIALLYAGNAQAQTSSYDFRIIYSFMKNKDVAGLKNAITNGVWIDSPDSNGINSLCHAIYQQDYNGYDLLRNLNADPNPPCLRRMSPRYRNAFFDNKPGYDRYAFLNPTKKEAFFTPKAQTIGTTALFAGLAVGAMTISSGGGGGSGEGGGTVPGTPVDIPADSDIYLSAHPADGNPDDYLTSSVTGSGFLQQIGAQYAYARGYDGRKVYRSFTEYRPDESSPSIISPSFEISDEVINVAVYDNGVYAQNPKLEPNIVKKQDGSTFGFNFDYGPCTSTNNTKCYSFDSAAGKLMFQDGAGAPLQEVGSFTQVEWDEYFSHYAADYVWNGTDSTPHQLNGNGSSAPDEVSSHGTHVAGIIGARPEPEGTDGSNTQGVVTNVGLIPVVFNPFGNVNTNIELLNNALLANEGQMDSTNQNIDIVNMSFGPDSSTTLNAANIGSYFAEHGALDTFFQNNRILVVAAGNEGQDEANVISGIPTVEGLKDLAENLFVTVVAVDKDNNITDYSNKCGSAANWCISAPGGTADNPIISTVGPNSIGGMAGTSMAAPTVTGSLALIMSAFPNLKPQEAVQILFETATDLGVEGVDEIYGHGLVNLEKASMPIGILNIPTDNTTTGAKIALNNSRISVPYNMANVIDKLPKQLIFLDKYSRPYPLATKSLFTTTDHRDKLKNDMKHFVNRGKPTKVAVNSNLTMTFSDRISDPVDNMQFGSFEFDYMVDKDTSVGLFFSENTTYKNGDYFSKVLSNPFLNINDAFGIKSGYEFNNALSFDVAVYTGKNGFFNDDERLRLQNDNEFSAIDYVFNFSPADYITFGFKGGFLQEDGSILGMQGSGAFATDNTLTAYTGLEIDLAPTDNLSIKAAYYQGTTKTRGARSDTLMSLSDIKSESISLDVGYKLNDEDKLGLQIAQPLAISRGNMLFDLPVGRDPTEDIVYREKYNLAMKPEAKELDLGFYFTHETKEDKWFRAEFGTRINPDNRDVDPDYRIMLGFGAPLN